MSDTDHIGVKGISQRSDGPAPDSLELKLSGSTTLGEDFRRSVEVEVTVRGKVMGHGFSDKYDKYGDIEHTTKSVTVKADELVSIAIIPRRPRDPDQQAMPVDGEVVDGEAVVDGDAEAVEGEIADADIVGELEGQTVDPETGEVTDPPPSDPPPSEEPEPEPEPEEDPDLEWK